MSNASIISRVELALDRYECGELPAPEVERAVGLHFRALEQIGSEEEREAGHLAARLIRADLINDSVEFEGAEPVANVLRDFRAFLARLPR